MVFYVSILLFAYYKFLFYYAIIYIKLTHYIYIIDYEILRILGKITPNYPQHIA